MSSTRDEPLSGPAPSDVLSPGSSEPVSAEPASAEALPPGVLVVRRGPGANCSSIGSAVEMLFLSATIGAAVLAAVTAALRPLERGDDDEPPTDGGPRERGAPPPSEPSSRDAAGSSS